jgi:hypothetical protein
MARRALDEFLDSPYLSLVFFQLQLQSFACHSFFNAYDFIHAFSFSAGWDKVF